MTTDDFDAYARTYDDVVQSAIGASGESVQFFADLKATIAREIAPAASSILDFGCGVGNSTRALAHAFPRARIHGVDESAQSVTAAAARSAAHGDHVSFSRLNADVPLPADTFDLAIAACVFHHIDRAERVRWVERLAGTLVRGGRLLIFEHNPLNPLTRLVVRRVPFDRGVRLLGRRETVRLVRTAGLRPAGSGFYFFFPHALRALRPVERFMRRVPFGGQYFVVGERT